MPQSLDIVFAIYFVDNGMYLSFNKVFLQIFPITVTKAVKIVNLRVPSQYIMLKKYKISEPLILDCEYDLPVGEKELVLKWYLNDQLIYQWISTEPPRVFVHVNYAVNEKMNIKFI